MTTATPNPRTTTEPPARGMERLEHFDRSFGDTRQRFEEAPSLYLTPAQEEQLPRFKALHYRQQERARLLKAQARLEVQATRSAEDDAELAEIEARLALPQYQPLTAMEQAEKVVFDQLLGDQVNGYLERSRVELEQAPKRGAFQGFMAIEEEIEADARAEPTHFSVLALEEVRVLLNRLFGKHYKLKAFFEEYVVLRYDGERAVKRAQAAGSDTAAAKGGAEIRREHVNGESKYVVTVDDATFIQSKTFTDSFGNEHRYTTADMVQSAFTIGRAILRAAFSDQVLEPLTKEHGMHLGVTGRATHALETMREGGAPHVVDLARQPGHGGHATADEVLDFMAFSLIDPEQAKRVDIDMGKNWYAMANKLLAELNPDSRLQLGTGQTLSYEQANLNYDYLYHDYDLKRRPAKEWAKWLAERWINRGWGERARMIAGGLLGGTVLGTTIGSTAIGPWRELAGLGGWAIGAFGGSKIGKILGGLDAPIRLIRSVQAVWEEKSDFFYELAESEHDKKEVARIMAREEQISDRDARLKTLIATKNAVDMRRLLQADSETGDWTPWRQLLYVMHFDHLFKETGGREITQESYNFLQRLQRISNAKKRHGTKPNYYKAFRDPYGRTRYQLRDWGELDGHVRYEWESRSEREAQGVIQEQFELMNDTHGWIDVNDKLGDDLDDPNSRGWCVGQVGDLRNYLGAEAAKEFLLTMRDTIGGIDDRYLLKMDSYARNTIQRMASFIDKKFPGEHTKIIAKEAYTHYLDKLPKYESKLDTSQEELLETLEAKTVNDLVNDLNVDDDKLVQLYRNVEFKTVDEEFPSVAKKKFPTLMVHGWIDKKLEHLRDDLFRLQNDPNNPLGEELAYEMEGLVDTLRESLSGAKSEEEIEEQIVEARTNLERLLDLPSVDEQQEFVARSWLIELTETQPRVEKLVSFRSALRDRLGDYRKEAKAGTPKQQQYASALDQLTKINTQLGLVEGDERRELVEQERDRVVALAAELETTAKERLGADFPKGKVGIAASLKVAVPTTFPDHLQKLIDEISKWYEQYKKDNKAKILEGEVAAGEILMGELQQFARTATVPEEVAGDREKKLRELKRKFVSFPPIPDSEKQLDPDTITLLTPIDMISRVKLSLAALKIEQKDEEWKGLKKEKGEKKDKGGDDYY